MNLKPLVLHYVRSVHEQFAYLKQNILDFVGFAAIFIFLNFVLSKIYNETFTRDELVAFFTIFIGSQMVTNYLLALYLKNKFLFRFVKTTIFFLLAAPIIYITQHLDKILIYSALITAQYLFFLIIPAILDFFVKRKETAKKKHTFCGAIVVLERNYGGTLVEIFNSMKSEYDVRLIVNLTPNKINANITEIDDLNLINNWFLRFTNIFTANKIKKIIYIAVEPEVNSIKKLTTISAEYNAKLFRTPYLRDIAKQDYENCHIIPITINDIIYHYTIRPTEKSFLLNYFRNKTVWVDYNGEPVMLALITEIAKTRLTCLNICLPSEHFAADIKFILDEFQSLPYRIQLGHTNQLFQETEATNNIVISTQSIKEKSIGIENISTSIKNNLINSINLINVCAKNKDTKLIFLSDIQSIFCKNWVGLTQRVLEFYASTIENKDFCQVIRVPFSLMSTFSTINKIKSNIENNGFYSINKNDHCFTVDHSIIINSIFQGISHKDDFTSNVLTITDYESLTTQDMFQLFLNIYGLKSRINITDSKKRTHNKIEDEFKPLPVKLTNTKIEHLNIESDIPIYTKAVVFSQISKLIDLSNSNQLSSIIDCGLNVLQYLYFGNKEESL